MTQEQLKQYSELNAIFQEDCKRVAGILGKFEVYQKETEDINFAHKFYLDAEGDVSWEGDEYWSYGGHEYHSGYFKYEYLSMTDEEVRNDANKENEAYLSEKRKRAEERAKADEKREFEKYKRLKEKFEK